MILFSFRRPTDPIYLAVFPVDQKINLVSPKCLNELLPSVYLECYISAENT